MTETGGTSEPDTPLSSGSSQVKEAVGGRGPGEAGDQLMGVAPSH